jgi:polyisoprenoid-binding protein YceI
MFQNRTVRILAVLVGLGGLVGALGLAYLWFSGGSGEPSTAISAPTLPAENSPGGNLTLFRIVPEESEVRFIVHEELMGNPTTVVGKTNQVAGDILVDFNTPSNTVPGTIRINIATLATDNEFRNRALRGQILQSNRPENEFAEFVPSTITGLSGKITNGEPVTFQITGNLTVRGVTRENTTFAMTVTPVNDTRLEGSGSTDVLYTDFGMSIPSAPGVANVTEAVKLEIDFVATIPDDSASGTPEAAP